MTQKMITKKNLKPKARRSAGNGATVRRGLSRYESEIRLVDLSPLSASPASSQVSGNDGTTLSTSGEQPGSPADASTRQKTALMLSGMLMESQKLGLVRLYRSMTKQGKPCIKVILELSPNGEWSLDGNTISFVGN